MQTKKKRITCPFCIALVIQLYYSQNMDNNTIYLTLTNLEHAEVAQGAIEQAGLHDVNCNGAALCNIDIEQGDCVNVESDALSFDKCQVLLHHVLTAIAEDDAFLALHGVRGKDAWFQGE